LQKVKKLCLKPEHTPVQKFSLKFCPHMYKIQDEVWLQTIKKFWMKFGYNQLKKFGMKFGYKHLKYSG
jgi:hypothetical protein